MIMPNKVISFEESVLSKIPLLVINIEEGITLASLYKIVEKKFSSNDDFICTMDLLYALDYLDVDEITGKIVNVNRTAL